MHDQKVSVSELARRMGTSRASVNRILDPETGARLDTLNRAGAAVGLPVVAPLTESEKDAIYERRYGRPVYRQATAHKMGLTAIAYELFDRGEQDLGEQLLKLSREITSMTIAQGVPEPSVIRSADLLFRDLKIDYCLIGGMAVNVHATPRGTEDVDILVNELPPVERTKNRQYMGRFGFYPAVSRTGGHLVLDKDNGYVECFPAMGDPLREEALAKAREEDVMGMPIKVVTPAFLIGLKVAAIHDKPSRRHKDGQDILAVYLAQKPSLTKVQSLLGGAEQAILKDVLRGLLP